MNKISMTSVFIMPRETHQNSDSKPLLQVYRNANANRDPCSKGNYVKPYENVKGNEMSTRNKEGFLCRYNAVLKQTEEITCKWQGS